MGISWAELDPNGNARRVTASCILPTFEKVSGYIKIQLACSLSGLLISPEAEA